MLLKVAQNKWKTYVNSPELVGRIVVFRSLVEDTTVRMPLGLGFQPLQTPPLYTEPYAAGDELQFAILARTTTFPTMLNIRVEWEGSENNLGARDLVVDEEWTWIVTEPVIVDKYRAGLYLYASELGKEIQVKRMALGDPASIHSFMVGISPLLWVGITVGITAGVIALKASKSKK